MPDALVDSGRLHPHEHVLVSDHRLVDLPKHQNVGRRPVLVLNDGPYDVDCAELVAAFDARGRHSFQMQASVGRVRIFNLNGAEWDATRDREGWRCSGTVVGERIGGELLGATMSQIEPGSRLWPYHTHYLNEEWVLVLRGEPTLRTPEGEHVLEEGDIVCFPRGKNGAHQLSNRTDSPVRVLMLSSMIRGEIIEYLDTGKVLAKGVDDEDVMWARPGPAVEYWEGED